MLHTLALADSASQASSYVNDEQWSRQGVMMQPYHRVLQPDIIVLACCA